MKSLIKLAFPLFLIAISFVLIAAQQSQKKINVPEIAKPFDIEEYKEWRKTGQAFEKI